MAIDRYDVSRSYDWNYANLPAAAERAPAAEVPGRWTFANQPVPSPLGVPAGPLLNGAWCLYYAALGFDVLTYKTVRSRDRACYPAPNLLAVDAEVVKGCESRPLSASDEFRGSWAISFGMPSKPPEIWTADVRATREALAPEKKLAVSVVGSWQSGWSLERLAEDYAECATLAVGAGADAVEINLSCPNVCSLDGQLYQNPSQAELVARATREAIGDAPLLVKIGHDPTEGLLRLLDALAGTVDGVATVNCIAATVDGAFDGQPRGIGGKAILEESVRQVERIAGYNQSQGYATRVVGVGGASTADDVRRYLSAGAEGVQMATAIMRDPLVGLRVRQDLAAMNSRACDE